MKLSAKNRDIVGKKVKSLRKEGYLPAVLYGSQIKARSLAVHARDFARVWNDAGESSLITLSIDGSDFNVLIHDVAKDPVRDVPIHADFYAVRMDRKIKARVPLEFAGESPAVKNEGGILVKVMHEIEIEALPGDLPKELSADVSLLAEIESRLFVKDVPLPPGVALVSEPDEVVAIVEHARSEEELTSLEAATEETIGEVKTEKEAKAEEKVKETEDEDDEEK